MGLRKVLGLGIEIDTILLDEHVMPGGDLAAEVRLQGGWVDHQVEGITFALTASEWARGQRDQHDEFHRVTVAGPVLLPAKESRTLQLRVPLPWETPLTEIHGEPIKDQLIQLRTELALVGAVDRNDGDPLTVRALPAQQRILDTLKNLGYLYFHADLERGQLRGSSLPIWQEIEFWPPVQHVRAMNEMELTFIARQTSVDVILEVSKYYTYPGAPDPLKTYRPRRGHETPTAKSRDVIDRFTVEYAWLVENLDWEAWVNDRIKVMLSSAR